ncbi:uncharacterized protein FFE2_16070 [Fusarium fujikuroi]|nr:uncharacterized protein FFE2_16070 [Fusarium fujikuroi]
MARRIAS